MPTIYHYCANEVWSYPTRWTLRSRSASLIGANWRWIWELSSSVTSSTRGHHTMSQEGRDPCEDYLAINKELSHITSSYGTSRLSANKWLRLRVRKICGICYVHWKLRWIWRVTQQSSRFLVWPSKVWQRFDATAKELLDKTIRILTNDESIWKKKLTHGFRTRKRKHLKLVVMMMQQGAWWKTHETLQYDQLWSWRSVNEPLRHYVVWCWWLPSCAWC